MSLEYTKKMCDHFIFFLVIIFIYGLSFLLLLPIPILFPGIYSVKIGEFLGIANLSLILFPMYLNFIMIFVAIIIWKLIPLLRINHFPHKLIQLVTTILLSINLTIFYFNDSLFLDWGFKEFIDLGLGYLLIINFVFFAITVLIISRLLYSDQSTEISNVHLVIRKALNEISVLIFIAFISFQLIFGMIYSGFDIVDITPTLRLIMIYLFALASQPEK